MQVLPKKHVLTFRALREQDIPQMHQAFLSAFSDYPIPFRFSLETFEDKFIRRLNISFDLSVGAFEEDLLVGFIFHTVSKYEGLKTVYNGGTGVIPDFRGKNLTTEMYDFILPKLKQNGVQQAVLEVISHNQRAIEAYKRAGFRKSKYFRCYRQEKTQFKAPGENKGLKLMETLDFDWRYYDMFCEVSPSFADEKRMIEKVIAGKKVYYAHLKGHHVGYIIFQPNTGRVAQLAVSPAFRRRGIGKALLQKAFEHTRGKEVTVINVNEHAKGLQSFLLDAGFTNSLNQFEMIMEF